MTADLTDALVWLRYAREDLAAAQALLSTSVVPRHPAWLAQQSAEKAMKALLVADALPFPKTHDLERLSQLLPNPLIVQRTQADLANLTEYAVGSRYPGDFPDDVTAADAATATEDVGRIVDAVEAALKSRRT